MSHRIYNKKTDSKSITINAGNLLVVELDKVVPEENMDGIMDIGVIVVMNLHLLFIV